MEMAQIGATEKGGVCRLALTDLDRDGRDLFIKWCKDAGCTITVDQMGNIFARRPGKNNDLPPIMTGSHLDTQPTGGKFDGVYGVLAGVEVLRTLNDYGVETEAPVEVAVWTNEEGSRFAPAMVASGVFAGVFDLAYGLSRADLDGKTMGQELTRIGYAGSEPVGQHPVGAYFEAHIEQGPILEHETRTIGVVTHAQGQRWYEITLTGQEAHAGPTPMPIRKDALVGAAKIVTEVNRIGMSLQPFGRSTVGLMQVSPNSRNTIPGSVFMTVDFRNPNEEALTGMDRDLRAFTDKLARDSGLTIEVTQIWHSPVVTFHDKCVGAVRSATRRLGYSNMEIVSGAGHDACYINRVAPTGMIFIPCEDGISHNEVENATPDDCAAGGNVLLHAMIEAANA
ncbi:Zn-dependent hydrolase [Lacibacterium aquatile]|uniref:Zn-dependent hydrolase n=1 Tax=Lacibacterium aquatile TaxID=1168082 RepID=A0ABW5DNC0_9PROT